MSATALGDYEPPDDLGDGWSVETETVPPMDVEVDETRGTLAAVWRFDGDKERAEIVTDDGVVNTAWERLEVVG